MILKVRSQKGEIKFSWKPLGKKDVYGPGDIKDSLTLSVFNRDIWKVRKPRKYK